MRSVRRSGRTERRPNQREGTCDHETDTTTNVSVDGVMQGPGGPDEDRRGGFERGGWAMPLFDGEAATFLYEVYQRADAFLFGPNRPLTPRKTIAQTIAQAAIDGARAPLRMESDPAERSCRSPLLPRIPRAALSGNAMRRPPLDLSNLIAFHLAPRETWGRRTSRTNLDPPSLGSDGRRGDHRPPSAGRHRDKRARPTTLSPCPDNNGIGTTWHDHGYMHPLLLRTRMRTIGNRTETWPASLKSWRAGGGVGPAVRWCMKEGTTGFAAGAHTSAY